MVLSSARSRHLVQLSIDLTVGSIDDTLRESYVVHYKPFRYVHLIRHLISQTTNNK